MDTNDGENNVDADNNEFSNDVACKIFDVDMVDIMCCANVEGKPINGT